jgi:hypothetical protein
MAHFAKVLDGKVIDVIVAEPEFFDTFVDSTPGTWIQTSYNTRGGIHYSPETGEPDGKPALRGNFAGIGFTYDHIHDVFYSKQPYPSWTLNMTTWHWESPVPYPADNKNYYWDEPTTSWVLDK